MYVIYLVLLCGAGYVVINCNDNSYMNGDFYTTRKPVSKLQFAALSVKENTYG